MNKNSDIKIGMVIAFEKFPYSGVVRPFINWAKEFMRTNISVDIILYKSGNEILNYVDKLKINYHEANNQMELEKNVKEESYDYLIIDDYIKRLKLLKILSKHSRAIVYAQVLFGIHAVSPVFTFTGLPSHHKMLYLITSLLPFPLVRKDYSNKISKATIVLANSKVTATLLYTLYGVKTQGVVYPPVDTEIFRPIRTRLREQVMLYLGSHGGDTDPAFVIKICRILEKKNIKVIAFGNAKLAKIVKSKCNIEVLYGLSDLELARLYSESMATIAPQLWEQFGYVVAESVACGTPAIAFNFMGPAEIAHYVNIVKLANDEKEFLEIVERIDRIALPLKRTEINFQHLAFSSTRSAYELLKIIYEHYKTTNKME